MTYFITHLYLIEQCTELLSRLSRRIHTGRVLHAEHNNDTKTPDKKEDWDSTLQSDHWKDLGHALHDGMLRSW